MARDVSDLIIGVDGGGSGCRAVIATRAGSVLGQGSAGPANATSDLVMAVIHVTEAIGLAAQDADLSPDDLIGVPGHVGLAGVLDLPMARQIASELRFRASVGDDRRIFVAGALGDRRGILLALGTGTIAAKWNGKTARHVGGYGLKLSDQASGAWLGRSVLERALLAHDGIVAASALTDSILARYGNDTGAIVAFAQRATPADYATLAPLVTSAGDDTNATALMERGAAYLARCVAALGQGGSDIICLTGGVGPHYAPFLPSEIKARLRPPTGTALDGALALAGRI